MGFEWWVEVEEIMAYVNFVTEDILGLDTFRFLHRWRSITIFLPYRNIAHSDNEERARDNITISVGQIPVNRPF